MVEGGTVAPTNLFALAPTQVPPSSPNEHIRGYSHDYRKYNVEVPLDIRLEKMRLAEALTARDHAVHCMESICASLRQKESAIARLQQEKTELEVRLSAYTPDSGDADTLSYVKEIQRLQALNKELQADVESLKRNREEAAAGKENVSKLPLADEDHDCPIDIFSPISAQGGISITEEAEKPENIIQARFSVLAELPLPPEIPNDTLVPIVIPPPSTIHDFLGTAVGALKAQLTNYRVFQESTTSWCPDREEHGYYLTPYYKCSTNPRVSTAHRWTTVDLAPRIGRSSECFYNKEGKWYYAGVYKSFRLRDLTPQEWVQLPTETTQALIKETLAARKNTSPQNVYETGQLYACGALRAACIGLQCIGFDEKLYRALLVQAETCAKTGRWRGPSVGLGTGTMWNVNANAGHVVPASAIAEGEHGVHAYVQPE